MAVSGLPEVAQAGLKEAAGNRLTKIAASGLMEVAHTKLRQGSGNGLTEVTASGLIEVAHSGLREVGDQRLKKVADRPILYSVASQMLPYKVAKWKSFPIAALHCWVHFQEMLSFFKKTINVLQMPTLH